MTFKFAHFSCSAALSMAVAKTGAHPAAAARTAFNTHLRRQLRALSCRAPLCLAPAVHSARALPWRGGGDDGPHPSAALLPALMSSSRSARFGCGSGTLSDRTDFSSKNLLPAGSLANLYALLSTWCVTCCCCCCCCLSLLPLRACPPARAFGGSGPSRAPAVETRPRAARPCVLLVHVIACRRRRCAPLTPNYYHLSLSFSTPLLCRPRPPIYSAANHRAHTAPARRDRRRVSATSRQCRRRTSRRAALQGLDTVRAARVQRRHVL